MATPPAALSSCRSASERLCSVVVRRRCRSDLGLQREQLPLHQGGPTGLTCRPLVGSGHTLLAWPRLGRTCLCRALRRCHGQNGRPAEVAGPEDRIGRRDRHELAQAYTCTSDDCEDCQWPISDCRVLPPPRGPANSAQHPPHQLLQQDHGRRDISRVRGQAMVSGWGSLQTPSRCHADVQP